MCKPDLSRGAGWCRSGAPVWSSFVSAYVGRRMVRPLGKRKSPEKPRNQAPLWIGVVVSAICQIITAMCRIVELFLDHNEG